MTEKNELRVSRFDYIFPGLISVLVFISILYWLKLNTNLPHWDMGRHLYLTTVYGELWSRVSNNPLHLASVISNYYYYPPLVHNIGLLFETIVGFRPAVAAASNIVWLLIIAYSIYFSALRLFGRWSAVASVFFALASPMIVGQLHEFQLDLPLTAMVSLSCFLLLKTERFTNRTYTLLLGVVAGLSMMTKWTWLLFFIPAIALIFVKPAVENGALRKPVWKNLLMAFLIALVICGAWYFRNLELIKADFLQNGVKQAAIEGDPYGFNKTAFLWYFDRLAFNYLFLPLLIYFLLGVITVFLRKPQRRAGVIFLAIGIVWYLIISSLSNKDIRYIMPEIFVLALIGGCATELFANKIYKFLALLIIVVIFFANWTVISFSKYLPFESTSYYVSETSPFGVIIIPNGGYTSNSPQDEVCHMELIIQSIPEGKSARQIGISHIDFSDWSVAYYLEKSGRTWSGQTEDLSESNYLIHRNTDELPAGIQENPIYQTALPVASFKCVDNSFVQVLRTNINN